MKNHYGRIYFYEFMLTAAFGVQVFFETQCRCHWSHGMEDRRMYHFIRDFVVINVLDPCHWQLKLGVGLSPVQGEIGTVLPGPRRGPGNTP